MTENLSSLVAAHAGFPPLVSVVHAEPTPYPEATLTTTATATKPLSYSEISSSETAPLTGYTGRYTQADPIGIGKTLDLNLYRYAVDNPLRFVDRNGLDKVEVCCRGLGFTLRLAMPLNVKDKHCFIRVTTNNKVPITYGLYETTGLISGTGCAQINDPADRDVTGADCATTECADPRCVSTNTQLYPCPSYYNLSGPNSNTFASHVASRCGLNTPLTANPSTAPGWGFPPAPPVR